MGTQSGNWDVWPHFDVRAHHKVGFWHAPLACAGRIAARNLDGRAPGMLCRLSPPAVLERGMHLGDGVGLGRLSGSRSALCFQCTSSAQR